ncbi:MAG: hypothetical protein ACFE8L_13175 [Candidatus Hodarchaeota archaeon]
MNLSDWKKWAYILCMVGCAQFIFFTFLGMLFYAGGTYRDPSIEGYSFFMNFFSDIGRTVAHSGESNLLSFVFFSLAFFIVGIFLVPSFLAFPNFFDRGSMEYWISIGGSILGIFSAFCFSGITFAPSDVHRAVHIFFVYAGFLIGFFAAFLYSIAIFVNKNYPKHYGYNFIVFTVILALYLVFLFAGPSSETANGLVIQVTAQKIVLYTFAICLFIHGYSAWKVEKEGT